jgi:2-polyprenyl-6-methoxyphenol hydroxylase-like FAD-dependent oxidoreductase
VAFLPEPLVRGAAHYPAVAVQVGAAARVVEQVGHRHGERGEHVEGVAAGVAVDQRDAHAARRAAVSREVAFTTYLDRTAPQLARRLGAARRTSTVTGMLRTPNYLRRAYGPGWALVGDAGYHRDAVTGHGISDAYRDAELLAVAIHQALRSESDEGTSLAGYQRQRDEALRDIFELTCGLASYPPVPEFVQLQKRLSAAIDVEAAEVAAAHPVFGDRQFAAA